jgi:membrane-bound lytic murein transglycosylase A
MRILTSLIFLLFLAACSTPPKETDSDTPLVLKQASFSQLPGWRKDDQYKTILAFKKSCKRLQKRSPDSYIGSVKNMGQVKDWLPACVMLENTPPYQAKAFFEEYFLPWEARAGDEKIGLFTGYYEAALNGSKVKSEKFKYPLRKRPDDLVMVDLGEFREDLKGRRIAGRVINSRLKPFEDRENIQKGALINDDSLALVWVDDPVDAFFLHIQGSGRVNLENGDFLRVGYDGQNGHPYYAIGRELIHRGYLNKENVSMQSIREWLENNPFNAFEVMNTNKSYVFFREIIEEGPIGGEGVALTPGRSLAIDHSKIAYGVPIYVSIDAPVENEESIQRLMVAQDTGGAIRGAVRGDVFWGAGSRAEFLAGNMKSKGSYWLLLPKRVNPMLKISLAN